MATPFVGEIRAFGFSFAPVGWAMCSGQIMPIAQNAPLFSLLGTTFGGDGRTNFGLPNLGVRAAVHAGAGSGLTPRNPGDQFGSAAVALTLPQLPLHTHSLNVQNALADAQTPAGGVLAKGGTELNRKENPYPSYVAAKPSTPLAAASIASVGGNLPHENQQPALTVNYCIALTGDFPARP